MIRKIIILSLLLIPALLYAGAAGKKTVAVDSAADITNLKSSEPVVLLFEHPVNLRGASVKLPKGSTLKFTNKGKIINGAIFSTGSDIDAPKVEIFRNVTISGTWNCPAVYGEWIARKKNPQPNNDYFKNLMALCTGDTYTHLYLSGTFYVKAIKESAPIIVPSHTYWHNTATINMLPNDYEKYNMVLLNKATEVVIDGGTFTGDVMTHYGKTGEWGHGIKLGGATNVVLKNFTSNYHWGDGIDLIEGRDKLGKTSINCDGITIDNVKCTHNRRQGMSIEAAINVMVRNSEFTYTGFPKFTAPGAGLDIEPWNNNCIKIKNITLDHCLFSHNKGCDLFLQPNCHQQNPKKLDSEIKVIDCTIGRCGFRYAAGIEFINCNGFQVQRINETDNVTVTNKKGKQTSLKSED